MSRQKTESRERSKSISRSKNKKEPENDLEAEIPATASTHRESVQPSSQPSDSQVRKKKHNSIKFYPTILIHFYFFI